MLNDFLGAVWRRVPRKLKRWTTRFSQPRFTVTAGAIIRDKQGRVLLLKHRFRPGTGWGLPGGFIKEGEQPEAALRRELREEVGLELDQVELFTTRAFKRPHQIEILFKASAHNDTKQLNFEIETASWFSPDELPGELPKDQAELIKRAFRDGAKPHD